MVWSMDNMASEVDQTNDLELFDEVETEKTVQAKTFKECVPKMISHESDAHPDKEHDQIVAIAHSKCREKFGISKARVLFLVEQSKLLEKGSLEDMAAAVEKNMGREDWIEFAALLKNEGQKHKQICDRVDKSPSWIKKYVNPRLPEVTPIASLMSFQGTELAPSPIVPIHTIIEFTVTELRKETRTFGGWGSVELKDKQNEMVSIKGLEAIMPTYIKRGAPIQFGHSNRHVGRVLKYQIKDKLVKGENIPGLWLEGVIFSDYKIDDLAWEALQYAHKAGLPVLSLGATPIGHPSVECNDKECFKKYNKFQLYEFTITEQQRGSIGANPEATVEVAMAKGTEAQEMNSEDKQWLGSKLLAMQKSGKLPGSDLELVNLMLSTCSACQDDYNNMLKAGDTEEQAKGKLFKELMNAMSVVKEEVDSVSDSEKALVWSPKINKLNTEIGALQTKIDKAESRMKQLREKLRTAQRKRQQEEGRKSTKNNADVDKMTTPQDEKVDKEKDTPYEPLLTKEGELDMRAFATEVMKRIDKIENAMFKQGEEAEEEEEEEEIEDKKSKKKSKATSKTPADDKDQKDSEPALTLSEDALNKKFEEWAIAKGMVKVAETPAPGVSEGREITKGQGDSKEQKFPTAEELTEAAANWKDGGPSDLAKKYGY